MTSGAVSILTYHSLDETGSVISTAPAVFKAQMRSLQARGFKGVALGELLDGWEGRRDGSRDVAITFDDGIRNVAVEAQPVLEELGFRATLFVVAGRLGATNDWPGQAAGMPRLPLLGSHELRELDRRGVFEIGSHGTDHASLQGGSESVLQREVVDSQSTLEDALGHPVALFAYPYGRLDARAHERARGLYRAACGVRLRAAVALDDRHDLPRVDAYYIRHPRLFRLLETGPGRAYLALRSAGRRVKQALG